MKRTKLKLTLIALGMLAAIAVGFIAKDQFEPTLWMAWFAAFASTLGIYAGANVAQKGVLKNEHKT